MNENEKEWTTLQRIGNAVAFFWSAAREIYLGIKNNRVPAGTWCLPGVIVGYLMLFHQDETFFRWFQSSIQPYLPDWLGRIHVMPKLSSEVAFQLRKYFNVFIIFSGWIAWGFYRSWQKNEFLDRLTEALEASKLKCNGRYPSFIEDIEIDEFTRRLRLRTYGVTKSEFQTATEKLETMMNVTIVRMLQEEDKGRLDIIYTTQDLPRVAYLENPDRFDNCKVPIGICREGDFAADLRHIGHILIAGQTGGGKSNILKVITSILAQNNQDAELYFLDFKGGMESADLKNTVGNHFGNVIYREGTTACAKQLGDLGGELNTRLETLTKAAASNLEDYQKKNAQLKAERAKNPDASRVDENSAQLKRVFLIVDEAAQLYSREPGIDRDLVTDARAAVNRIARQGRAAGVHLIIATQKPDNSCFDPTVKANLPAVLCFPMANQSSSVSAVGCKRAYELNPDIKGRAIWKFGPQIEEVQTYAFN